MNREVELDAVRGLAAFSVLLYHSWLILPASWHSVDFGLSFGTFLSLGFLLKFTPLHLLVAGPSCVALFFVLSGYVLSLSMYYSHPFRYGRFLIRRICRIYLPFAAAIFAAAWAYIIVSPGAVDTASSWLTTDQWSVFPSGMVILGHLLMIGTPDLQSLDPPMWSLVIEMRASIIFPPIYALMIRSPRVAVAAGMICYLLASTFMEMRGESVPTTLIEGIAFTIEFLPFFMLGILLFMARGMVGSLYATSPVAIRRVVLLGGVVLLGMPSIGPQTMVGVASKALWLIGVGFGSVATIILALHSNRVGSLLRRDTAQWLGKVSYSLYLTHMLVLFTLIHSLHELMPLPAILCLALPICLVVAGVTHRFIELPAMRLGYVLTMRRRDQPLKRQTMVAGLAGYLERILRT